MYENIFSANKLFKIFYQVPGGDKKNRGNDSSPGKMSYCRVSLFD